MKDSITEEWLMEKYIQQDKSQREISQLANCSRSTISRRIKEYGIEKNKYKKYNDEDWLNKKYNKQGLTQEEISNIVGVDPSAISKHLKKNNLLKGNKETCQKCEKSYLNLSRHWASFPSHKPEYSRKQKDILIGILMSDGWISSRKDGRNCRFQCEMITKEYIKYLKDIFGVLCNNITYIKKEEQQDIYRLSWKPHDFIDELSKWYSSGEKVWPEVEMTPTILKHYYVGDGHLRERGGKNVRSTVSLGMANELGNKDKIRKIFSVFDKKDYSLLERRPPNGWDSMTLLFTADGTEKFFEYIGKQELPGFEYKWC